MLFLVSTPIGNLKDITLRAIETLKSVDYILCEDTRVSKKLLHHYEIKAPLIRADAHKEKEIAQRVIDDLKNGKNIALISDAGTPLIQDPGELLLSRLIEENLPFTAIPGASAPLTALLLSGFPAVPFHFLGFIPKGNKGATLLEESLKLPGTLLFFETAPRIKTTLNNLERLAPKRRIAVTRELTKYYEEVLRGTAKSLLLRDFRGELVVVIAPLEEAEIQEPINLKDEFQSLVESGTNPKEALAVLAKKTGMRKKDLYQQLRVL